MSKQPPLPDDNFERQAQLFETSARLMPLIAADLDADAMAQTAVDLIRQKLDYASVSIYTLDSQNDVLVLRATSSVADDNDSALSPSVDWPDFDDLATLTSRTEMTIPLKTGGEHTGALVVRANPGETLSQAELGILTLIAEQIGISLVNAQQFESQRKLADNLAVMDRMKTQFIANMNHDLRTPLNAILGFTKVILKGIDGPVTPEQKADLNMILEAGQHLLELINEVLDFSRLNAGKMEIYPQATELIAIVRTSLNATRVLVGNKPIRLQAEIPADLPQVYADPTRIRQLLLNLLSNAAKFTDQGAIIVRARVTGVEAQQVEISVEDSGIGISTEDLAKIFQPFQQLENANTRESGSGLRLSITRQIVELHDGQISVASELGVGSTFTFTLPVAK